MKTAQSTCPPGVSPSFWVYTPQGRAEADAELRADSKRILAKLDLGHIYVVEFTSGVVKVGKSTDPRSRIATHRQLARMHGGEVRNTWVSHLHYFSGEAERELIEYCARIGQLVVGREYFRAPFAEVRSRASLLAHNRFTPEDMGWPEPPP